MKRQLSLKTDIYSKLKDVPPYEIVKQSLLDSEDLIEKDDYLIVGSDIYIRTKALLYIIGRFSVTNVSDLVEFVVYLSQEEKKIYNGFNDNRLPQLNTREQEWNDCMIQTIRSNARFLQLDRNEFLSKVYKEMDINFHNAIGDYLQKIGMPDITRITKFRVVTCDPKLRIAFEDAMSRVMVNERENSYRRHKEQ